MRVSWAAARAARRSTPPHLETLVPEDGGDGIDDRGLVVDDQNLLRHISQFRPASFSSAEGWLCIACESCHCEFLAIACITPGHEGERDRSVTTDALVPPRSNAAFKHEAMLYAGIDGFVNGTAPFLREGVAAGEPALVVVSADKIRKLRAALGADADAVFFADMADVGANPARIIPAWRRFVDDHAPAGRPLRGIGEPIYPERSPDALVDASATKTPERGL